MTSWVISDYLAWIKNHCPVVTTVVNLNLHAVWGLDILSEKIVNLPNLETLSFYNNRLSNIPVEIGNLRKLKNLHLPNCEFTSIPSAIVNMNILQYLSLANNRLVDLPPEIGNLHNLQILDISENRITNLPDTIWNLPSLCTLYISENRISELPKEIGNLPAITTLDISNNFLKSLPVEIGNLHTLITLGACYNLLETIPVEIGNLQSLVTLNISYNQLTVIPAEIGNIRTLRELYINDNPVEYIPPNITRLLNRQRLAQGVYQDTQSVHNSTVQQSIKASIMRLIAIKPIFNSESVLSSIMSDLTLAIFTKQSLIQYCHTSDIISEVNVTFLEVLTAVWSRIVESEHSMEIKEVLNSEMADAECKCFTGRVSRLVNCLSGFDELVEVKIADNEQIGNVISVIGDRLKAGHRYTVKLHREIASIELKELGYTEEVIRVWLEYIE